MQPWAPVGPVSSLGAACLKMSGATSQQSGGLAPRHLHTQYLIHTESGGRAPFRRAGTDMDCERPRWQLYNCLLSGRRSYKGAGKPRRLARHGGLTGAARGGSGAVKRSAARSSGATRKVSEIPLRPWIKARALGIRAMDSIISVFVSRHKCSLSFGGISQASQKKAAPPIALGNAAASKGAKMALNPAYGQTEA